MLWLDSLVFVEPEGGRNENFTFLLCTFQVMQSVADCRGDIWDIQTLFRETGSIPFIREY